MEEARYIHQLRIIGEEGQRRLRESRVVVMGCGGLGSAAAAMLARAGVGNLVVVDRDVVEPSNLHRQILYDEADIGKPKAEVARTKLMAANSEVMVEAVVSDVQASNVLEVCEGAHLVVDGADNIELRLITNEACVKMGIPFVHGAVRGTYGVQFTVIPGQTACYSCLIEDQIASTTMPDCAISGVIGPAVMLVASHQVTEAIKLLTGKRHLVRRTLVSWDLWTGESASITPARRQDCPVCGLGRFVRLEGDAEKPVQVLCGRNTVLIPPLGPVDLEAVAITLPEGSCIAKGDESIVFIIEECRVALFRDGRAIVHGTEELKKAVALIEQVIRASHAQLNS